jgi:hypothetical protein
MLENLMQIGSGRRLRGIGYALGDPLRPLEQVVSKPTDQFIGCLDVRLAWSCGVIAELGALKRA